ncbi:alpha/beta fold hydrolase [Dongia rigui]|uniref:Alpha/beta hydrolase n=1 Tax=Dongia rigui TaxID=940149 RepID=A0ABU5E295_9PROT|nr:alpha/beta hydrolase [Dongia rigui]MDY0873320.1 alpha/beta hydrolase [Dongia rigui]
MAGRRGRSGRERWSGCRQEITRPLRRIPHLPHLDLDGVTLWYDTVPSPNSDAPPALLIQGLGMQATDWPASLLSSLASTRPLILFDNRDAGLSQLFGPQHDPELREEAFPGWNQPSGHPPYTLFDMAADTIRLLDALEIPTAHLAGFSMGGMIAQILGAQHPDRVSSVSGLMTSAGQDWLNSTAEADRMMRRSIVQVADQESLVDFFLAAEEVFAGPSLIGDRSTRYQATLAALSRGHHTAGIWRQALAMRATGDRRHLLGGTTVPLLMVHGREDPVIAFTQAAAITELRQDACFIELSQTGHVLTEDNGGCVAGIISAFWDSLAQP